MPLAASSVEELFKQGTDKIWLVLLTFDHATLGTPIRVTSDGVQTVSRGDTFEPYPFTLALPSALPGELPRAALRIDNVDRLIVAGLRTAAGTAKGPTVLMEIVRFDTPDTVEGSWPNFYLDNVTYDALIVAGELRLALLPLEPFPGDTYNPENARGVFR